MRRMLKEPLLHFLVLGAVLFGVYAMVNTAPAPGREAIVVSAGEIENIAATFARTWQRAPTADELRALVDDRVEEEVLCREAVRLGLDQDDTVIRRRLRQKMEFLSEDFATTDEPTGDELRAYLDDHGADFAADPRYSLTHVFVSEDRGDLMAPAAAELLERLRAEGPDADTRELGDRLMIPFAFRDEPRRSLAVQLGAGFVEGLDDLPVGEWAGPVPSAYGLHLVLVRERTEGRIPPLEEIRDQVRRDVLAERRERAYRALVDRLSATYEVTVEWPEGTADLARTAAADR